MESKILKDIHKGYSRGRVRLFRNNVGIGLQGSDVSWTGTAAFVKNAKYIRFGLCVGSSDLIGWQTVTITPDMVGKDIAQFVALEVKDKRGRVTKDQKQWLAIAESMGAKAAVVRSLSDAKEVLGETDTGYKPAASVRFTDVTTTESVESIDTDRESGQGFEDFYKKG